MSWTYNGWTQDDSVNFGFPYASSVPAQADFSEVKSVMKLKQNQNFGFPYTAIFTANPFRLMAGRRTVRKVYLGTQLVWQRNGINRFRIGSREG